MRSARSPLLAPSPLLTTRGNEITREIVAVLLAEIQRCIHAHPQQSAAGASPFTIMEVLGHSPISTTQRYTHTPFAVLEAALTKVGNAIEEAAKRIHTERE